MKRIRLSIGLHALVDDDDFQRVSEHKWHGYKATHTHYASAHVYKGGKRTTVSLGRFIMEASDPKVFVDHINGNGLDNRSSNLRFATNSENVINSRRRTHNSSGQTGVHLHKPSGKWCARIMVRGKRVFLGHFEKKEEAVTAYREASLKYFGEFSPTVDAKDSAK